MEGLKYEHSLVSVSRKSWAGLKFQVGLFFDFLCFGFEMGFFQREIPVTGNCWKSKLDFIVGKRRKTMHVHYYRTKFFCLYIYLYLYICLVITYSIISAGAGAGVAERRGRKGGVPLGPTLLRLLLSRRFVVSLLFLGM